MMTVEIYNGDTYIVPKLHEGADDDMFKPVPNRDYALAFLMQDGNLAVPCGRYGSDTRSCAPVAWVLSRIMQYHSGEPITYYQLDSDMALVVNSADDVAHMIREYAELVGENPADYLDAEDLVETEEVE